MEAWMNDVPAAVLAIQRQLRAEVPELGRRHARLTEVINDETSAIRAEQAQGGAVPQVRYGDVAAGRVTPAEIAHIKRRGCLVIRGVFDPAEVQAWNEDIGRYIDEVRYLERMSEKAGLDRYFSALGSSRPQIFSLYWSRPQMLARQHPNVCLLKGEGPAVVIRRLIEETQGVFRVLNGRGGLELPDNLRAGCVGMIPAPECFDVQVRIFELMQSGQAADEAEAERLYRGILPLLVFLMQSLENFL